MLNELNDILKKSIDEFTNNNEYSYIIESFLNIVLSNRIIIRPGKYKLTIPVEQSIKYSIDFINSINNRYADIARKLLSTPESCHIIYRTDKTSYTYEDNGHPNMYLFLGCTLADTYTITHEIFHCINLGSSLNRALLTETISITAQRLQQEYLKRFLNNKECQQGERDIFYGIAETAYMLDFELKLIKHYIKYNEIDKNFFDSFISIKNRRYNLILEDIEKILSYNQLLYEFHSRYIIAIILSTLLFNRIKDNPDNIKLFIDLNDNCNCWNFIESLEYLGLDVVDNGTLNLSNDSLNELEKEYQKSLTKI